MVYFVENLTLRAWFLSILPHILWNRVTRGCKAHCCYVIDGLRFTILVARASAWIAGITVDKLAFRFVEVRDEAGLLLRLRITYQDMAEVQAEVVADPIFRDFAKGRPTKTRLLAYLAKRIATVDLLSHEPRGGALLLVQICAWKTRNMRIGGGAAVLFLERRPWLRVIERYASRHDVTIVAISPSLRWDLRTLVRRVVGPKHVQMLRVLSYDLSHWRFQLFRRRQRVHGNTSAGAIGSKVRFGRSAPRCERSGPRVAVEYLGHLNLNQPELHSDLFFWQRSSLSDNDILVIFGSPLDPLDEKKWAELTEHGMAAVALNPQATTLPAAPVFTHHPRLRGNQADTPRLAPAPKSLEAKWLRRQVSNYAARRAYWRELFETQNVKVYVAWFKHDETHCAIADALQALSGVTAIYQRSCEFLPSAEMTVSADIVFGFSQVGADIERRSNSNIGYHVTTGYLRDHYFSLLCEQAQNVRKALRQHGATHIVAFFDENSADDSRWHSGHEFMRENYVFLLEKVLAERWLGLVLKPKVPRTLRRRLGPVAELLERAKATGRCYVYEGGAIQGTYPPAAAALAADFAIQGHLCAATAGFESALAGVPTLLMDREGWHVSPLYRLGVGRVVFTDWQGLWETCVQHWARPAGIPGFGDWSPMLDELDPFRDGRAAERMGTYIQWLIEGFKAGLDRDTIMANAAERYCAMWGKDKVTEVSSRL